MKTIKFLAALAIPAMFAACTNEELLVDAPLQNQEIVGAELVGTDIAINVNKDGVDSRYANGAWELTDKLGLGWAVDTDAYTLQKVTKKPNDTRLYANHMFQKETIDGAFVTKGNVYTGWHFAYYPFERMATLGDKQVNFNPEQDCLYSGQAGARYHNRFAISALHFLGEEGDIDENNQLTDNKKFNVQWVTNEIILDFTPSKEFVDSKYLNNLEIDNVELSTTAKVLKTTATLDPTKITPVLNKDGKSIYTNVKDKVANDAKTKEVLLSQIHDIFAGGYTNKAVTTVSDGLLTTGANSVVRIHTMPYSDPNGATITPQIRVNVSGGYFLIKKVTDAKALENSLAVANNEALEEMIAAYEKDGVMLDVNKLGKRFKFNLYPEIFYPDFKNIDDYNEWKLCVNIINALKFTEVQDFNIIGDIKVPGNISMPNVKNFAGIKVTAAAGKVISFEKKMTKDMPANLDLSAVDVVFNANQTINQQITANSITNNATMTIAAGTSNTPNNISGNIINDGVIIVNKYAKVSGVDNTDSRIEIKYGGIAETTVAGTIYYELLNTETANQINKLVEEGNVNTFVVNTDVEFNLNKIDPANSTGDEYGLTPGVETPIKPALIAGTTIEMNGGSVIGNLSGFTVDAIKVLGAETNSIKDVVTDEINVAAGTLIMDASMISLAVKNELQLISANVTVAEGATLIANANTEVDYLENAGTVKANSPYYFHFQTGLNTGTLTGNVEECTHAILPDFTALETNVKNAFATWKTAWKADPLLTIPFSEENVVTTIKGITTDEYNAGLKNKVKAYNALKDWYEAKGIICPNYSDFTADYITMFNLLNDGDTNDLTMFE